MLLVCVITASAAPSSLMVEADAHAPSASYAVCSPHVATLSARDSSTYSRPTSRVYKPLL